MIKKELEKDLNYQGDLDQKIEKLESEKKFSENLHEIDWKMSKEVTIDFPYIPKGFLRVKYALINFFIVKPFTFYQAKIVHKLKVKGKQNIKGIKSAIVTSNHVAVFDCLVNAYALRPKKVKTLGAEFNNRKGRFGEYMRIGGMLPLSSKKDIMRKLNSAIEYYIDKNQYILIYPEQSMWHHYEKPRPLKTGAFFYAVKHNVPVIPIFITYRTKMKKGKERKFFTVNILPPLYKKDELSTLDQSQDLADRTYRAYVETYEKTYNKKLEYATGAEYVKKEEK